jgi:hypothetical protein
MSSRNFLILGVLLLCACILLYNTTYNEQMRFLRNIGSKAKFWNWGRKGAPKTNPKTNGPDVDANAPTAKGTDADGNVTTGKGTDADGNVTTGKGKDADGNVTTGKGTGAGVPGEVSMKANVWQKMDSIFGALNLATLPVMLYGMFGGGGGGDGGYGYGFGEDVLGGAGANSSMTSISSSSSLSSSSSVSVLLVGAMVFFMMDQKK